MCHFCACISHGLIELRYLAGCRLNGVLELGKGIISAFARCLQLSFFLRQPVQCALRISNQIGFAHLILLQLLTLVCVDVKQALNLCQIAVKPIARNQQRLLRCTGLGLFLLQIGQVGRKIYRRCICLRGSSLSVGDVALSLGQCFLCALSASGLSNPLQVVQLSVEAGHTLAQAAVFLCLFRLTF